MRKKLRISASETPFPAPLVVVGTYDPDSNFYNIATFVFVGQMNENPPVVFVGVKKKRFTYELIKKTGEFTLNFPSKDLLAQSDFAGLFSGRRIDKFASTSLTPVKGEKVSAPLIEEFPLNFECRFLGEVEFSDHNAIYGEVVNALADESIIGESGGIDFEKMKAVVGNYSNYSYYSVGDFIKRWGFSNRVVPKVER